VEAYFNKMGWKVLGTYINTDTPLECKCPKGHDQKKRFYDFRKKATCTVCLGLAKPTIDYVKKCFADIKYELLSTEYVNNRSKLAYKCNKGHIHSMSWSSFKSGTKCPYCVNNNFKYTYEFVKDTLNSYNYILLETQYKNNSSKLLCSCPNGYSLHVTFKDFLKGHRCGNILGEKCQECRNYSPNRKGGVVKKNIPLYTTYASQLEKYQPVYKIEQNGLELLGVECTLCKKVFIPGLDSVERRIVSINKSTGSESNLYCSGSCKKACPTYKQHKYPKGKNPNNYDRPDQKQWATLVKERDNYTCQKCGSTEGTIVAHHILPMSLYPIESADIDNGITYCEECHKEVHKIIGCTYNELKCTS
jgi:5-methylcytosine-specific restriction endonuclease McrA